MSLHLDLGSPDREPTLAAAPVGATITGTPGRVGPDYVQALLTEANGTVDPAVVQAAIAPAAQAYGGAELFRADARGADGGSPDTSPTLAPAGFSDRYPTAAEGYMVRDDVRAFTEDLREMSPDDATALVGTMSPQEFASWISSASTTYGRDGVVGPLRPEAHDFHRVLATRLSPDQLLLASRILGDGDRGRSLANEIVAADAARPGLAESFAIAGLDALVGRDPLRPRAGRSPGISNTTASVLAGLDRPAFNAVLSHVSRDGPVAGLTDLVRDTVGFEAGPDGMARSHVETALALSERMLAFESTSLNPERAALEEAHVRGSGVVGLIEAAGATRYRGEDAALYAAAQDALLQDPRLLQQIAISVEPSGHALGSLFESQLAADQPQRIAELISAYHATRGDRDLASWMNDGSPTNGTVHPETLAYMGNALRAAIEDRSSHIKSQADDINAIASVPLSLIRNPILGGAAEGVFSSVVQGITDGDVGSAEELGTAIGSLLMPAYDSGPRAGYPYDGDGAFTLRYGQSDSN